MAATVCFFVSRIVLWFFLLFFCTPIKMLMKKRKKAKTEAAKVESQVFFWRQWKLEPAVEWLHPLFTWCFQSLSDVTPPAFNAGLARGCFSSCSSSLCSSSSSSSGGDGGRRLTSPRRDRCRSCLFPRRLGFTPIPSPPIWRTFPVCGKVFFFPTPPNNPTVTTLRPYLLTLQVLAGVIGSQYPLAATTFKPSLVLCFAYHLSGIWTLEKKSHGKRLRLMSVRR